MQMNDSLVKKTIAVGIVAVLFASILTVICTRLNYNTYVEENNKALLRMVTLMLDESGYGKDEIVQMMENRDDIELEEESINIIESYGYTEDTEFFLDKNEENLNNNIIKNLMVVDVCVIGAMIICYLYLAKRQKKVNELIHYLQQLQDKNYVLKIDENEEEELSNLQNELYKIMILLKEQAEQSMLDKQTVKNNIVDISHQLKTPLTSTSIMIDNIMEYPEMDEETKGIFLANIRDQMTHMEVLVQNLLKLSRFDANVVEFKKEPMKVENLIEDAVRKNRILIEQKKIEVTVCGSEAVTLIGDFTWQSEAVSNIIKNAVEHSYQNGKIEITFSENNFVIIIKIRDYGTGIKKENLKKIFTRFYKASDAEASSIGVGLNLAQTIVEKNNGNIRVYANEGEGVTFEIRYMKNI